jgi:adenylosuccinate lyase
MDYETYLSPFTWRYGSDRMRRTWSEAHKRRLWRRLWVALAEVQAEFGLASPEQVADLRAHEAEVDVSRSLEIEAQIHHDLMAELQAFAESCPVGGGILHLGATSADIEDNADALRTRQALALILESLRNLLTQLAGLIAAWADLPVMAFTHLQPAEPTTLGYRFAGYAQDLLADREALAACQAGLRGKGFKGAVGTSASYAALIGVGRLKDFEARLSEKLGLPFYPVAAQTYQRKQDYQVLSALAGLGGSLYKLAFDLRVLQSPAFGELSEPFGAEQVGSSAMPFKRNPIQAEKIDSLGRLLAQFPRVAWDNAAHSLLERTLDDSANRRVILPEAFLIADEMLRVSNRILAGLQVNERSIRSNLEAYGAFAGIERVLMALSKAGADRQVMHSRLREHALAAREDIAAGRPDSLAARLTQDPALLQYLDAEALQGLLASEAHLGDAPQRAREFAEKLRNLA